MSVMFLMRRRIGHVPTGNKPLQQGHGKLRHVVRSEQYRRNKLLNVYNFSAMQKPSGIH